MLIVAKSIFWTSLGIFLLRGKFVTSKTPKLLGKLLYWIGIPLQILALARRSDFSRAALLPSSIAIVVLLIGMSIAILCSPMLNSHARSWLSHRLLGRYKPTNTIRQKRAKREEVPLQFREVGKNKFKAFKSLSQQQQWIARHNETDPSWHRASKNLNFASSPVPDYFSAVNGDRKLPSLQSTELQPRLPIPPLAIKSTNETNNVYSNKNSQRLLSRFTAQPALSVGRVSKADRGSFVLASMLGNTGFIGLAIAPALVSQTYWSWIVIYGVAHNVLGSYGLGVVLANYYGRSSQEGKWLQQLCHIFTVPSLWAFTIGWLSRDLLLPKVLESGIQTCSLFVVPGAFLLIGMQLSKIQKIESWFTVLMSTAIKISFLPIFTGLSLTLMGLNGDARLSLVLMSGMPTAFANVILAEEYDLNRQIAASTILLSTVIFPLVLPLWLFLF